MLSRLTLLLAVSSLLSWSISAEHEPASSSSASPRLVALIRNNSPILNIFEKYTEFFIVIGTLRHAIEREEIHRYGIAFEISRISQRSDISRLGLLHCDSRMPCSEHDALQEGVKYRYLALAGARLIRSLDSHIFLLLRGVRRYISEIDADLLIAATDLQRDLLTSPYSGPTQVELLTQGEVEKLPLGPAFNDITFDSPPSGAQRGVVVENRRLQINRISFNPSIVQTASGSYLVTNRNEGIVPRSVIEVYNVSQLPLAPHLRVSKPELKKHHRSLLGANSLTLLPPLSHIAT